MYNKKLDNFFGEKKIQTSFLDRRPFLHSFFRWYLPLMPLATELHRLPPVEVVLSSSSAFAKGIIPPLDALHVCYCHTPTRYLWSEANQYIEELRAPRALKIMLPFMFSRLRLWDFQAAQRVHFFIANSYEVQKRIQTYYHRPSKVIYPPVEINKFLLPVQPESYFLTGGRLVAYKCFDVVLEAFNRLGWPLVVFGDGPEAPRLKQRAKANIRFTGSVSDEERANIFSRCQAFITPQREDFGLTTAEAQAAGRPVIAYRAGGSLEIIKEGVTGVFFDDQCWEAVADAVLRFKNSDYSSTNIRQQAQRFSKDRFIKEITDFITQAIKFKKGESLE